MRGGMEINMEIIIENIFLWVLYLAGLAIYAFLIAVIIPKYLLQVSGDPSHTLGRGLKKFVYPDGRAVVYEPHPSIRKYVKKYALFTLDGYKYVQLCIDSGVKDYVARVTMFDNRNKIIDSCEIYENVAMSRTPSPVKLHENTSYIAFSLLEVNRASLVRLNCAKMRICDMPLYFAAVFVATFLQFVHIVATLNRAYVLLGQAAPVERGYAFFILPALAIGVVCLAITVINRMRNGVKVVFK